MRLKRHQDQGRLSLEGYLTGRLEDLLMTSMYPIEIADRQNPTRLHVPVLLLGPHDPHRTVTAAMSYSS